MPWSDGDDHQRVVVEALRRAARPGAARRARSAYCGLEEVPLLAHRARSTGSTRTGWSLVASSGEARRRRSRRRRSSVAVGLPIATAGGGASGAGSRAPGPCRRRTSRSAPRRTRSSVAVEVLVAEAPDEAVTDGLVGAVVGPVGRRRASSAKSSSAGGSARSERRRRSNQTSTVDVERGRRSPSARSPTSCCVAVVAGDRGHAARRRGRASVTDSSTSSSWVGRQQGEQVVGVVRRTAAGRCVGSWPVSSEGTADVGERRQRGAVAVPGRVVGEGGQVREPRRSRCRRSSSRSDRVGSSSRTIRTTDGLVTSAAAATLGRVRRGQQRRRRRGDEEERRPRAAGGPRCRTPRWPPRRRGRGRSRTRPAAASDDDGEHQRPLQAGGLQHLHDEAGHERRRPRAGRATRPARRLIMPTPVTQRPQGHRWHEPRSAARRGSGRCPRCRGGRASSGRRRGPTGAAG